MKRSTMIVLTGGPGGGKSRLIEELQHNIVWVSAGLAERILNAALDTLEVSKESWRASGLPSPGC